MPRLEGVYECWGEEVRMWRIVMGFIFVVALMADATAWAGDNDMAAGAALYKENCGMCHGEMPSQASHGFGVPAWQHLVRAAMMFPSEPGLTASAKPVAHGMSTPLAGGRFDSQPTAADELLAVAPPFGPPLRGVYGRPAGSVEGFPYSHVFKNTLQGVVWNHDTLDRWITDSQAWVPGSRMFYQQPDAEIRRQIITYLEANP
jgi:cytochrome c2